MKKIFTLLFSLGSFTALFAQDGRYNDRDNGYRQPNNEVVMNNNHERNYERNNVSSYPQPYSRERDERNRPQEIDRRDADYGRGNDYGYGRPVPPPINRDRRVMDVQHDRRDNNGSFAKGAVVGGIAGVLLGVLIAHH